MQKRQRLTTSPKKLLDFPTAENPLSLGLELAEVGLVFANYLESTVTLDQRAAKLFELPAEMSIPKGALRDFNHPDDRASLLYVIDYLLDPLEHNVMDLQHQIVLSDGSKRWICARKKVIYSTKTDGITSVPTSGIAAITDITKIKTAEERSDLVLGEMRHRLKNIFNVVQSLARMSSHYGEPSTIAERFCDRIQALAENQDIIIKSNGGKIDLHSLVDRQTSPFNVVSAKQITIDGAKLLINADAAHTIGLCLHELATNACKYGALSDSQGKVLVEWVLSDLEFNFSWKETGGPTVIPPKVIGFGQRVLKSMAEASLMAEVEIQYLSDGLVWNLKCPFEMICPFQDSHLCRVSETN